MEHLFLQADELAPKAARFAAASLYTAVEENDLLALNAWRDLHSAAEWNQLFEDPERPGVNLGTIGHWAIWFRHWKLLAFWLARGGQTDIPGQGSGGWMVGMTLTQYAQKLDDEAGHDAFEHVMLLDNILTRRPLPGFLVRPVFNWGSDPSSDSDELVNLVEANDFANLSIALATLGAEHLRSRVLTPSLDNPFRNGGTLAHWAVWHRHWGLLAQLVAAGAVDRTGVKGTGTGWMSGRSVNEYTLHLDQQTRHNWYNLSTSFDASIAPPPAPPAISTAPPTPPHTSIAPQVPLHPPIRIRIRKLTGAEFTVEIDRFATIASLQLKIEERESVPPAQQRIIFSGRQLSPETTLADAAITNDSFVHLVLALR